MLKLFSGRQQKLVDAITSADLDKLAKLLAKFEADELDARLYENQSAVELAIRAHQPKSLELLLNRGCDANATASCDTPFALLALQQSEHSLALLTQLLRAGADANTAGLLCACFTHCAETELMVHISRLIEHGCRISEDAELMVQALATERLELIHFLINSGANLPADTTSLTCSEETLAYAKRCEDDRKVREMMQQF
ncbi:hypothetical protein [Pontibacterium sp.]|uniref:hypothetical protein n=1 Tax=Pontibacterium sp. TaxID=2036026 RepID=UPI003513E4F2